VSENDNYHCAGTTKCYGESHEKEGTPEEESLDGAWLGFLKRSFKQEQQ